MNVQIWFVDCQKDFIENGGKLQVPNAMDIVENLSKLRQIATQTGTLCVYTKDMHFPSDEEISDQPDFKTTFPSHCVIGSDGSELIDAVQYTKDPVVLNPKIAFMDALSKNDELGDTDFFDKDLILTKSIFSTFDGNSNAMYYLEATRPDIVFVCGVAGDICVKAVVEGLIKANELIKDFEDKPIQTCVVNDAIQSINNDVSESFLMKIIVDYPECHIVTTNFVTSFLIIVNQLFF
jgi:nicotinamidase/pyrazinamidase